MEPREKAYNHKQTVKKLKVQKRSSKFFSSNETDTKRNFKFREIKMVWHSHICKLAYLIKERIERIKEKL
jgi:hypothetical protein